MKLTNAATPSTTTAPVAIIQFDNGRGVGGPFRVRRPFTPRSSLQVRKPSQGFHDSASGQDATNGSTHRARRQVRATASTDRTAMATQRFIWLLIDAARPCRPTPSDRWLVDSAAELVQDCVTSASRHVRTLTLAQFPESAAHRLGTSRPGHSDGASGSSGYLSAH